MFNVELIDGEIEFSNKAFRTLQGAKKFAHKIMDETSEWGVLKFGKTLGDEEQDMFLVRWEQGDSVEEMTHAEWLNT